MSKPIKGTLWAKDVEGHEVAVEIERSDVDEVALHIDDQGLTTSLYWPRSRAIEIARQLLNSALEAA